MAAQLAWIKPALWGVVIGGLVTMIVGFSWLGWVREETAERMAMERANTATIVALTPACVSRFMAAPDAADKLKELQAVESWKQREFVEAGGWATPMGDKSPNSGVANACAEELMKTKS